jgi:hypothetical protein
MGNIVLSNVGGKISIECEIKEKVIVFFVGPSRFHGNDVGMLQFRKHNSFIVNLRNLLFLYNDKIY